MSALDEISDEEIMKMIGQPAPPKLTLMQAAAPELYQALEMAAKDLHTSAHFLPDTGIALLETVRLAHAALAKARGETP